MKFYLLPFRFWEIALGGLLSFIPISLKEVKVPKFLQYFCFIGQASYSIFIWHQIIIAFFRYFDGEYFYFSKTVLCFSLITLISALSFIFIEKHKFKITGKSIIVIIILIIGFFALKIYFNAGVVRDIPELDINKESHVRGMHSKYNDRIYQFNKDFDKKNNKKIRVFVIGNSFARDFANILLESKIAESIVLSYLPTLDKNVKNRAEVSDFIFVFDSIVQKRKTIIKHELVNKTLLSNKQISKKVWGIGTKNFGVCNGQFYIHRKSKNYKLSTTKIDESFIRQNEFDKKYYTGHFINFIDPILSNNNQIHIFTSEGKFFSQDGRHLTKSGAKEYAKIFETEIKEIFKKTK